MKGGPHLSGNKLTITPNQMSKILAKIREDDRENGGDILSNYGDVESDGLRRVISDAVRILSKSESDVDFAGDLIGSGGKPETVYRAIEEETGKSGIVIKGAWKDKNHIIYVATDRKHIKSAEPIVKDDNGNILPLSLRFSAIPNSDDMRFAKNKSMVNGKP